jgi:hypothetical protein
MAGHPAIPMAPVSRFIVLICNFSGTLSSLSLQGEHIFLSLHHTLMFLWLSLSAHSGIFLKTPVLKDFPEHLKYDIFLLYIYYHLISLYFSSNHVLLTDMFSVFIPLLEY